MGISISELNLYNNLMSVGEGGLDVRAARSFEARQLVEHLPMVGTAVFDDMTMEMRVLAEFPIERSKRDPDAMKLYDEVRAHLNDLLADGHNGFTTIFDGQKGRIVVLYRSDLI